MDDYKLLTYLHNRRNAIEKNKTGDVFCSGCLMAATAPKSKCCDKDVLSKDAAFEMVNRAISSLSERIKGT